MSTKECCESGPKVCHESKGEFITIDGIESYSAGKGDKFVVLCTDVFGHKFANVTKIADCYAAAGFRVLIPNYLTEAIAVGASMANFGAWLEKNSVSQATEITAKFLKAIKQEFKANSIQLQGYCYGAKPIFNLLAKADEYGIKSACVAHPSFLVPEDAKNTQVLPLLFLCAETDNAFTPDSRKTFTEILKSRNVPAQFIEYPGTTHGFAVRGQDEVVKMKAVEDTIKFFQANA